MTRSHIRLFALLILVAGLAASARPRAETGARLWLRYDVVADTDRLRAYRDTIAAVSVTSDSPTGRVIEAELRRGLAGLLGREPVFDSTLRARHLLVGTPARTPAVAALGWTAAIDRLGPDGFLIRSATSNGHAVTVITAATDAGVLYGTFHFLRLLQTGAAIDTLDVESRPRIARRMLNHWDNLDGTVERGYAGASLWWPLDEARPDHIDDRIIDYARANASLGINGAVINNVNADPRVLTAPYLRRVAAIAAALRPYGIRVYLSANAAAPRMLEALDSADPLAPAVAAWWRAKADEIYARIPDFGGFVVKANSEGQPGPQDYGRTHADGANVLADALAPHRGIVMWRAFVYNPEVDPDRIKRAYTEFVPLDGRFRANAFVQVKNGPLDFQPREPFHPLFGAMPKTPLMAELQITQEYLGHSNHLAYLAPMWKEFFDADTFARGSGSTVARVVDGTLEAKADTGIAGVANAGRDRNWTGHDFAQANWYAFGRLAWDPGLGAADIADEWIRMTWSQAPEVVAAIKSVMLESREALVRYSMPLGLHHLIGGDHYAPMPENDDPRRLDWTAIYYHRADATAIGVDRTRRGNGAVDQYFAPLRDRWNDPTTTPEALLLWFHRLPWTHRLASGRTVWEEIVHLYDLGVEQTRQFEARWTSLRGRIDDERYQAVLAKLQLQARDAAAWRDKCLRYFQTFSKGTLPPAAVDIGDPPLRARMPAGMRIGAALNQAQSDGHDPSGDAIVSRHFDTISPENLLKWERVHPEPERFAFDAADRFVAYGETRGLDVIGHTLIWHHQTPGWVFTGPNGAPADRETLLARMRDHIHTVVGRYRGRIRGWDVVNEALEEDGSLRRSPWLTLIGEDYLARAFAYAHEADPRAELYYNDFNLTKPRKLEGALRIVDDLKARGVRIDGVGEQGHWRIDQPSTAEIDRTLTTIAAAGVTPMITELDVDVLPRDEAMSAELGGERRAAAPGEDPYRDGLPAAVQARLAERYRAIFTVLMAHRARLSRVTFWGVTDRDSWLNNFPLRGRVNHPLLWDRRGQAKPAFAAVVAALDAPSR